MKEERIYNFSKKRERKKKTNQNGRRGEGEKNIRGRMGVCIERINLDS